MLFKVAQVDYHISLVKYIHIKCPKLQWLDVMMSEQTIVVDRALQESYVNKPFVLNEIMNLY